MTATMKALLEKLSSEKDLAVKASKLNKAELIALAKELGFALTDADFDSDAALNEDDLAAVVGGINHQGLLDMPGDDFPSRKCVMVGIDPNDMNVALL